MKRFAFLLLAALLLFAGCAKPHEPVMPPVRIADRAIKALVPAYTLASAYEESDVVALVRVGDWLEEDTDQMLCTMYAAVPVTVYKGEFAKVKDSFILVQEGCSTQSLRELPLFAAGNELLLFLTKADGGPYENAYFITGNYTTMFYRVKDANGSAYCFDPVGSMGRDVKDAENLADDTALKNRLAENEKDTIVAERLMHSGWLFRQSDLETVLDSMKGN